MLRAGGKLSSIEQGRKTVAQLFRWSLLLIGGKRFFEIMARHSSRYLDVSPASLTSTTTTTTSPTDQTDPRPHRSIDSSKQSSSSIGFNSLGLNLSTLVPDYARTPNLISPLALSPVTPSTPNREESTRIQLQRQKLREQKANALLSTAIPGYRTSAGEFRAAG